MNILLIEDNMTIIKGLKYNLESNNYLVTYKLTVKDGEEYINNNKVKYIIFKSRREGYDIRTLIDSCRFNDTISHATDINIAKEITGINDLIYVDVHGKLCCTKTLESAIQVIKYNEGEL